MKKEVFSVLIALMLVCSLVLAACAAPAPAPAPGPAPAPAPETAPAEVFHWELYNMYSRGSPRQHCWYWDQYYIDEIEALSEGRIKITGYWAGEHPYGSGDAFKVMNELHPAILEVPLEHASADEPSAGISEIILLYPPKADDFFEITDGIITPLLIEPLLNKYGYKTLIKSSWTPDRLGGVGFAATSWDALDGKRIRVSRQGEADWVEMMGGTPVLIPFGEIYTSLATGLVDGMITNSAAMVEQDFFDYCDTLTFTELLIGYVPYGISFDAFNALPADLQKKLNDWAEATTPKLRRSIQSYVDHSTIQGWLEQGFKLEVPSPAFREEMRSRSWEAIWKPWIERAGGPGSPAAEAFNTIAKALISAGYTVPNYEPY